MVPRRGDGHVQAWIEGVPGPLPRDSSGTFAGFAASNRRENSCGPEHGMRGERGLEEDSAQTGKSADGHRRDRTGGGLLGSDRACHG
jgi:hypothetical protein